MVEVSSASMNNGRAAVPRSRDLTEIVPPWATRLLVIFGALLVWEVVVARWGDPMFISGPIDVVIAVKSVLLTNGVPRALLAALLELTAAFSMALVAGVILGMFIGLQKFAYLTVFPIVIMLYAIPQSTILPLFTIAFGTGSASKIAYGFTHGIFPITVTVIGALQNIRPLFITTAVSMGASRYQTLRYVVLPYLIPSLFTGMRLAMTSTLVGVLLAELYVSGNGIGYFTRRFGLGFDSAKLFALILMLAAVAVILNESMRRLEIKYSKWAE